MLGDQSNGISCGCGLNFLQLSLIQARRGHDQRDLLSSARLDDLIDGGGHREIDDRVGGDREIAGNRHVDRLDAGDQSGVFAESRVLGRINRRDDGKVLVGRAECDQPLAHTSCGAVDCDA